VLSTLEQLQIDLAQLNHAKRKILGTLVKNDDGTPKLDVQGQPQFKGGVQSFIIGDTTYFRVRFKELTDEIQRVEQKIINLQARMRPPKKRILDYSYGI